MGVNVIAPVASITSVIVMIVKTATPTPNTIVEVVGVVATIRR
jgi:hypothetical protein